MPAHAFIRYYAEKDQTRGIWMKSILENKNMGDEHKRSYLKECQLKMISDTTVQALSSLPFLSHWLYTRSRFWALVWFPPFYNKSPQSPLDS